MRFNTEAEAITYVFRSLRKLRGVDRGLDEDWRDVTPTRRLLAAGGLPGVSREYAVVTGSKGKGSTAVITAKLLQHLGHTVGLITSPHLVTWRERIRVNGRAIPESDLVRILSDLAPEIDAIEATLSDDRYFSPQGIFLALALRWFDEQGAGAAVIEVGRGGRFDDMVVVPNHLSLFAPIMLEHTHYLGSTLGRIAWHKAGIIKPESQAISVPQASEVAMTLRQEADRQGAELDWITPEQARYAGQAENGIRLNIDPYGEMALSLLGRYQVVNAALAVRAAAAMHRRLGGVDSHSQGFAARIRTGLADVTWPGRCQQLQDAPAVYLDGAINGESARLLVESLDGRLNQPVISVIAVPDDKDFAGVYAALGEVSQGLILTETERNPILHFPDRDVAINVARQHNANVTYEVTLAAAVERALQQAGEEGTVLIVGTQSILADATLLWGYAYLQI